MSIRVCGSKSERLINFIARPLVGGMGMTHYDSAFNRHPNPARGCVESVNWNLKAAELSIDLLARVLMRWALSNRPAPTLDVLQTLYAALCRKVPFDNVRKLIH